MYISDKEKKISNDYLKKGYVIYDITEIKDLEWIRDSYLKIIKKN